MILLTSRSSASMPRRISSSSRSTRSIRPRSPPGSERLREEQQVRFGQSKECLVHPPRICQERARPINTARRGGATCRPFEAFRAAAEQLDRGPFSFYASFMKAMVLERPGSPLVPADLPDPEPGPGQVLLRVRACGVCRTDVHIAGRRARRAEAPARAGPPDRRRGGRGGPGRAPLCGRQPRRRPVARRDLRRLRLLPLGRREPVRPGALYRASRRRRLRRAGGGRRTLLLPDPRRLPRPAGRAAALRRAHRVQGAATRRRREAAGLLRVRLRGSHGPAGRAVRGARGLRLHAARRLARRGVRPRPRGRLGGRIGRAASASRWTRRSSLPRSARWCPRPRRRPCAREGPSSARAST